MAVRTVQSEEIGLLWGQVLESVKGRIGSPQAFDTWFKPIVPRQITPEVVELEVPNAFFIDWLHEHHLPLLHSSLKAVLGGSPQVRFALPEEPEPPEVTTPQGSSAANRSSRSWLESQLSPRHTFDTFVVGAGNRFTHAACRAVAENPGYAYNPLFIFGGSGLGKTHLLHAVGHAVRHMRPDAKVTYVPAERFTNEMIFAIQHTQTLAFRNRYRNVDVLLIDDIQFLAGKEGTQEEFFYTFNALRDAHKQIVVTADKPPKDIQMFEERLSSRFNQGLVTEIKHPDLETRIAILRQRCAQEQNGVTVPDDVLLLMADRIRSNIRDLEGCLVRLIAVGSLTHQDITAELAEDVLRHYVNPEAEHMTPERILAAVSERFGVRPDVLCGQRRTRGVVLPRQVAMFITRQLTDLPLVEIGRFFGNRDHSTVLYACEKVAGLIAADSDMASKVNGLISTLASA